MEATPTLSVVIATVGRPGLTKVLYDIAKSNREIPMKIILVLDGVAPNHPERKIWEGLCTTLIITPSQLGPSAAFSIGMREVTTDFFRIFTDDDLWLHSPLKRVLLDLEKRTILVCRSEVHDELGVQIRSSNFPITSSPLESVYAPLYPWRRNNVYFHLTSMIFPIQASQIIFNEKFVIREDLDWLQRLFELGFKFRFSQEVLVRVFPSHLRSAKRQTIQIDIDWVNRLSGISMSLAKDFVYFHCFRSFALIGDPFAILRRLIPLQKIVGWPNLQQLISLLFYFNLSIFKFIQHILSGK